MKRRIIAFLLVIAGISGVFAAEIEIPGFKIRTPRTTGMGNAYISIPKGFETLWTNPASFTTDATELTILGLNASAVGKQSELSKISASSLQGDTGKIIKALEPVITGSGAGFDMGVGLSWVGKRLGLGLYGDVNAYVQGDPLLSATGNIDGTISLMGGYAHPFRITDDIILSAGIALRPSLKYLIVVDKVFINDAMNATSPSALINKYMGQPMFGLPIDLGVRSTFPFGLSAAMTVKDIYTRYQRNSATTYAVPLSFNVGGAWNPDLGAMKWLLNPTVSLEVSNLNKVIGGNTNFFRQLHIGTELALLNNFITLWGGFDGGYPAFGTSFDLFIVDLSVAYGTTEFGKYLGDRPVSNLTVEVSFRID